MVNKQIGTGKTAEKTRILGPVDSEKIVYEENKNGNNYKGFWLKTLYKPTNTLNKSCLLKLFSDLQSRISLGIFVCYWKVIPIT